MVTGLCVSFITLLLLGLILEIGVRLFVPGELFWPLANVYVDDEDSEIGYRMQPSYSGRAFGANLETNRYGFRGPDWSVEKEEDVYRIAMIGDSHAFGYGVPYEDSIGEVLAGVLNERTGQQPRVEVLNFAVSGYNAAQELAVYREVATGFDPDMVVVLMCSNDHEPAFWVAEDGWQHERRQPPTTWTGRQMVRFKGRVLAKSRLFLYTKILRFRAGVGGDEIAQAESSKELWLQPYAPGPVPEELMRGVYEPLRELITHSKAQDTPVLLATFAAHEDWRRLASALGTDLEVPVLELLTLFPEAKSWAEFVEQFSLGWDSHMSAEALRRCATALADFVR